MVVTKQTININGREWVDATDTTTAGPVYNMRDVLACGGETPWIIGCSLNATNFTYPEKKQTKTDNSFLSKKDKYKKPRWQSRGQ